MSKSQITKSVPPLINDSSKWRTWFELALWMGSASIFFNYYNLIGELARQRGVDYTPYIFVKYDLMIPVIPWTIIPYILVYTVPFIYTAGICYKVGVRAAMPSVRRMWLANALMLAAAFAIFYYFPTQISDLADYEVGDGWLDILTFQFVHKGLTKFCAFPSLHVANVWYSSSVAKRHAVPGDMFLRVFAWLQFICTVGTRAHFLWDLPAGWILAELFYRAAFVPLEKLNLLSYPTPSSTTLALSLVVPAALYAGLMHLSALTGWGGFANFFS